MSLLRKLETLLNEEGREKHSDTPDYILAAYMLTCLQAFEMALKDRDLHTGKADKFKKNENFKDFDPALRPDVMDSPYPKEDEPIPKPEEYVPPGEEPSQQV